MRSIYCEGALFNVEPAVFNKMIANRKFMAHMFSSDDVSVDYYINRSVAGLSVLLKMLRGYPLTKSTLIETTRLMQANDPEDILQIISTDIMLYGFDEAIASLQTFMYRHYPNLLPVAEYKNVYDKLSEDEQRRHIRLYNRMAIHSQHLGELMSEGCSMVENDIIDIKYAMDEITCYYPIQILEEWYMAMSKMDKYYSFQERMEPLLPELFSSIAQFIAKLTKTTLREGYKQEMSRAMRSRNGVVPELYEWLRRYGCVNLMEFVVKMFIIFACYNE